MIKGSAKIELTNTKTGETQVIEQTNMITNAVKYYNEVNASGPGPVTGFDNLFGGILLFEDPIYEDPDNYYPPADNIMTGNSAVGLLLNTEVTELGNYNSNESIVTKSEDLKTISKTYVYDFPTDRGNGKISCVCLCPKVFGEIGFGNANSMKNEELKYYDTSDSNNLNIGYVNYYRKYSAMYNNSTYKLVIGINYKKNFCALIKSLQISNKSTLDVLLVHNNFTKINPVFKNYIFEFRKIKIPENLIGINIKFFINDDKYIYFSFYNNNNTYIWRLDDELNSIDVIVLENESLQYNSITSIGDYLYFISKGILKKYNMISKNIETLNNNLNSDYCLFKINKCLYIGGCYYNNQKSIYRYDEKNNKFYICNFENSSTFIILHTLNSDNINFHYCSDYHISLYNDSMLCKNPFLLTTINNLETPVTKTSDMTMKITYTISSTYEE